MIGFTRYRLYLARGVRCSPLRQTSTRTGSTLKEAAALAAMDRHAAALQRNAEAKALAAEAKALARIQAVAQGRSTRKRLREQHQQLVALRTAKLLELEASMRLRRLVRKWKTVRRAHKEREARMMAAATISAWARQCIANRRARVRRHAEEEAQEQAAIVQQCVQAVVLAVANGTGYSGALDGRGRPHGRGKLVEDDGSWYDGQWVGGERHGSGRRTWADGARYEGEWTKGAMQGTGSHISAGGLVRRHGVWAGDPPELHGEGTMVVELQPAEGAPAAEDDGAEVFDYSGQFERGQRHGAGRETRGEDGAAVYEGQWQRDLRHGVGTVRTTYESYSGEWVAGVRCGAGEHEVQGGY